MHVSQRLKKANGLELTVRLIEEEFNKVQDI
jgi:hypothetical protein